MIFKAGIRLCVITTVVHALNTEIHLPADPDSALDNLLSVLRHSEGHTFKVTWTYTYNNDSWTGDGSLDILGQEYLHLNIPSQEVLIQKNTIMIRYPETDQVVIDYFNRHDPSNIFAIFLGQMDSFSQRSVAEMEGGGYLLTLTGESLVGFDSVSIIIDKSWLPQYVHVKAGEDITVSVHMDKRHKLVNPDSLIHSQLSGSEIIDMRW